MITYNQPTIFQKIIPIPNDRVQTLNQNPFLLLPAFSGYYTILNVALDYDNVDVNVVGGFDWQIVNLNALALSGGNDNIFAFLWTLDNRRRSGIMQGINASSGYIRNYRNEPIYLYSNGDDNVADFIYANINIVYTQNPIS